MNVAETSPTASPTEPPVVPAVVDRTEQLESQQVSVTPPAHAKTKRKSYPQTDAGNAELFAELNSLSLRYDHRRKKWLCWGGHTWSLDSNGLIIRRARDAARRRLQDAESIEDTEKHRKEVAWALESEQTYAVKACLAQAIANESLADSGEGWDSDPFLIAVLNGVVDLRTGKLRPGNPRDRITMRSPVAFDPSATCPRWGRFLREVFNHDEDLVAYIQLAVGYCLTGDTSEQCLFLAHGDGSNGKSTFLNAIGYLLGDYSHNLPFSSFEIKSRSSIPNDVAGLVGKRFVTSVETGEAQRLNESRVKALTGGDPITARFLHGEFFTFHPAAKFWLAFNHKPQVRDDSFGFWRRIHFIPFNQTFEGASKDRQLEHKLRNEAPGILNWAIQGCLDWRTKGLHIPEAVTRATKEYQEESNILVEFFDDCCLLEPEAWASSSDLFRAYFDWAKKRGEKFPIERTAFGSRLAKIEGLHAKKSGKEGTRGWAGIRVKTGTAAHPTTSFFIHKAP